MKALTIIQPWATLIALGEKRFETRSWATRYRGPLAIHAGKKVDKGVCHQEPFKTALAKHGYTADNLPAGAIVATCNLVECHKIIAVGDSFASSINDEGEILEVYEDNEFTFGWYEEGRFAWKLTNGMQYLKPVPAKGQQGLWNWEGRDYV